MVVRKDNTYIVDGQISFVPAPTQISVQEEQRLPHWSECIFATIWQQI